MEPEGLQEPASGPCAERQNALGSSRESR